MNRGHESKTRRRFDSSYSDSPFSGQVLNLDDPTIAVNAVPGRDITVRHGESIHAESTALYICLPISAPLEPGICERLA